MSQPRIGPFLEIVEDDTYFFDAEAAERPVRFIETLLIHYRGDFDGKPFRLFDWQKRILRDLFGWKRRSDGRRRFKTTYIEAGKGCGKSPFAAALGLYVLCGWNRPAAEVYAVATETKQAEVVFDEAKKLADKSPRLRDALKVQRFNITWPKRSCKFEIFSGDPTGKHGTKPMLVIFDEIHEQKNRKLWDACESAMAKVPDSLMFGITNAGDDRTSICWELRQQAERVLRGESNDDTFYPALFHAPDDADPMAPESWRAANPSLGETVLEEDVKREATKAREMPSLLPRFRRFYLSQWVQSTSRWLDGFEWDKCRQPVGDDALAGRRCVIGMDASRTYDLTGIVPLFLDDGEGFNYVLPQFWLPRVTAERREQAEGTPFMQWAADRHLELVDGPVIDEDAIVAAVQQLAERYTVVEVAFDPHRLNNVAQRLEQAGLPCVPVAQGWKLTDALDDFYGRVATGRMRHGGNPMLDWCAANAAVMRDSGGNIRLVKPQDASKNVDGITAAVTALKRARTLELAAPQGAGSVLWL